MLFPIAAAFTAACLFTTPFLWPHPPALVVITLLASVVAGAASVMSILDPRFRPGMVAAGALLALANFAFPDAGVLTVAVHGAVGFVFIAAGLAPEVKVTAAAVATMAPAAHPSNEQSEPVRHAA